MTLLWMGVIFWFSAQPAVKSAGMSGEIIKELQQMTMDIPVFGQLFTMNFAEYILRKGAHIAEYAVLGALLLLCVRQYLPGRSGELWKNVRKRLERVEKLAIKG